jgi:protein unc-119
MDKNKVLFEIQREQVADNELVFDDSMIPADELRELRTVRYQFDTSFLDIKTVGTSLIFKVGKDKPVKDFRMIERHYFRDQLIQSYDFSIKFCIPDSTNEWENIYQMSPLDNKLKQLIVSNPYETKSDSFYFVGGELVMHNKAEYDY